MRVVSAVSFLTPAEVAKLATHAGVSQSSTMIKRQAQQLGFLQALGSRIGFPQRTVATAQLLLLRFHLFYPPKDFVAHEVAIACLTVASKICDTPKKAREIILSSWALRYPDLVRTTAAAASNKTAQAVAKATGDGRPPATTLHQQPGLGVISESDVDAAVLEKERKRIVSIESLVLQSIAFNFNLHVAQNFRLVVKIARTWRADKVLAKLAWQTTADCHRTYGPLCYPPATIAIAGLYCAALLLCKAGTPSDAAKGIVARLQISEGELQGMDDVETAFLVTIDSVEDVVHSLLDLYLSAVTSLTSVAMSTAATPISPATPASPTEPMPSDYPVSTDGRPGSTTSSSSSGRKLPLHVYAPPPYGLLFCLSSTAAPLDHASPATGIGSGVTTDIATDLTQIKIDLRQEEDKRRARASTRSAMPPNAVAATLVRAFDKGGLVGDVEQVIPEEQPEGKGVKDHQNVPLQRFLF